MKNSISVKNSVSGSLSWSVPKASKKFKFIIDILLLYRNFNFLLSSKNIPRTFSILPKLKKNVLTRSSETIPTLPKAHINVSETSKSAKNLPLKRATVKKGSRMFRPDVSVEYASHLLISLSKFYYRCSTCLISHSQAQSTDVALIHLQKGFVHFQVCQVHSFNNFSAGGNDW